jgi:DNA polymerase III subunit gamma/tau
VRRALAAAVALAVAAPCLAGPASSVEAENERRARAGLLPRKAPPSKPAAPAQPPGAAPVPAHPPPVPPVPAAPRPEPIAAGPQPRPHAPLPGGPLEAAAVAARALAGAETAPSNLVIDAVPVSARALSVTSTVRVRAGRVTLSVEPAAR